MNDRFSFIFKILIFSAILSYGVKYGGRLLPLEPSTINALLGISVPPAIMGLALWWRKKS
ncbi:hypothetical protein [Chroococcus sp. FPU101]|uniref:hypothetical protein n=1 Tax=Chroococcus sp. FPU101 TaxID=1974212 RepID=UPI001A8D4A6F|nr:hypothetical protein [Chroococcus sp. FPU101]GFE70558.1 hypothetical protein CFPU101_31680 [Chroococcus sp. FPU101]